jgi:thimet oligopeptidase
MLNACSSKQNTAKKEEAKMPKDVPQLNFDLTTNEIKTRCSQYQKEFVAKLDLIAKMPSQKSTLLQLDLVQTDFNNLISPLIFLKDVSPEKNVRDYAEACNLEVQKLFVDIYTREDLFNVVKGIDNPKIKLKKDEKILLEENLAGFKRNGLELEPSKRKVFIEKKKKLVALESEFQKNVAEWNETLEVTKEELEGLPKEYIESLKKTSSGNYILTLDYPTYFPFMDNAKNENARKKLEKKFQSRGGEKNKELLEEAIVLRAELAEMLGFKNHAEVVLDRRMAKNPKTVLDFLNKIKGKLQEHGKKEIATLLELKRKEENNPKANVIHSWDWRYYDNQLKKIKYEVDQEAIKEYFPLEKVLSGMFEIYQQLLGVKFVKITNGPVWHPSVQLYKVMKGQKILSYFYMDLFPREGKYSHAAAFTLVSGYKAPNGEYVKPVSSIVANFNPSTKDKPSLLPHKEVETMFHEFGHIMHQILTNAELGGLSGTNVKTDFVEAPSQMLENWVWEKEGLEKLSSHYKDGKPLPKELLEKLLNAKLVNIAIFYLRQLSFGFIDMEYHTSKKVDSTAVYHRIAKDVMMIPLQEGTMPQASFGHLMGGYDAGYYGYLWSKVYAQDMFTRFQKEGLLSPKVGADYVKWILEPGGTEDPFKLISGFLGRKPNEDAFFKSLGL